MPGAIVSGAMSAKQAARVFLERSPYVSWAKQLPAFRHPAFTGVVHPDLPIWAGEPNPPPEPAPGSHASLPRIARLAKTETEALPEFHVQTISGARCGSIKDVKERIAAASDAGASAILMVTGDSGPTKVLPRKGTTGRFDSVRLLKEAAAMRARGEVHEDVHLACVANPSLEGSAHGPGRLRAKLEAGAEMVVTQPALIQSNHRAWWDAVKAERLHLELEVIFGVTHFNNVRSLRFWHGLCGVEDDAEGAEEARVWEEYERTMDAETFAFWRDERLDLATSAALADVDGDGVHLMPVTEEGYAGVARLADTIQALASARSS